VKNLIRPLVCVLALLGGVTASAFAQEIVLRPGKSATTYGAWTKVSDSTASAQLRADQPSIFALRALSAPA
jgi:hypothetical protein